MTAEDVNSSIENWMRKEKLRYESQDDMFIIYDSYGKWVIPKYRYEHVTDNFFFALKTMKHKFYKCTVIFRETKEAHELWDSLPEEVIERLNLSVLLVAENGTVTQLIY